MIAYTTPHAIRVEITQNIYCLIVSDPDSNVRSFFLIDSTQGDPVFMFGCETKDDTDAAETALANAPDYIPDEWL